MTTAHLRKEQHPWSLRSSRNSYRECGWKHGRLSVTSQLDLERLLQLDPDTIFLDSIPRDRSPAELFARPEFSVVRAIREHRVYAIPHFDYFAGPIYDDLYIRWMADVLYGARASCRLRNDIRERFRSGYNYFLNEGDIDAFLMVDRNKGSAGYGQFTAPCTLPQNGEMPSP